MPGEAVWVIPNKLVNFWDIKVVNFPSSLLSASVRSTANQIAVASGTIVAFNAELRDLSNSWNSTTYNYTAKVAGEYLYTGMSLFSTSAVNNDVYTTLRQFNAGGTQLQGLRCGFAQIATIGPFFGSVISQKLTMGSLAIMLI